MTYKNLLLTWSLTLACACTAGTHQTAETKEAWSFEDDPGPLAVKEEDLVYLDPTMNEDGSKYDPKVLKKLYESKFSKLPALGKTEIQPWTDTYWPALEGGISAIWNVPEESRAPQLTKHPKTFWRPTKEDVLKLSISEIAQLSPAHKYEIYAGQFDFLGVEWEQQRTRPAKSHWEGLCDGWASASINFDEPHAVVLTNPDGIRVPFGSSDVKALLTYYQSKIYRDDRQTRKSAKDWRKIATSTRCRENLETNPEAADSPECQGVNPGSFHIIIANRIGLQKKAVVIDIVRDAEVWNQPVFAYQSKIVRKIGTAAPKSAKGTVERLVIKTRVTYTQESSAHWSAMGSANSDYAKTVEYEYELEINRQGEIVGGQWISWDRPDYMSHRLQPKTFDHKIGHWTKIKEIYEASRQGTDAPNPILSSLDPK